MGECGSGRHSCGGTVISEVGDVSGRERNWKALSQGGVGSGYLRYPELSFKLFFISVSILYFAHGAFGFSGNVERFASTSNEKICHWASSSAGRNEEVVCRFEFTIDH